MINKVSFYIPCFNGAKTIGPCLEAVFKQEHPIVEVIVVDDGSTDESPNIISRYPVRLLSHASNQGLAATRNTAIKNAKGDFIASVDADCCPQPDWLGLLMQRLSSSGIAGSCGRLLEVNSNTVFDEWRSLRMRQDWDGVDTTPPFLFGSNAVFHREALLNIGLYDEQYKSNYEDVDMCLRLKENGFVFAYEPKASVCHLRSDNLCSLLDNYWKWNFEYYRQEGYYATSLNLARKIKDNIGLANRYLDEDIINGRHTLIYLDFLLSFHHSLKDLEYFISLNNNIMVESNRDHNFSLLLAMSDLALFCHFNDIKDRLPTLIPRKDAYAQNFLALILILSGLIKDRFKNNAFEETLYAHLFLSLFNTGNSYLLKNILRLINSAIDWKVLVNKSQANINRLFLENFRDSFNNWLDCLNEHHYGIIDELISSARFTGSAMYAKGKGGI